MNLFSKDLKPQSNLPRHRDQFLLGFVIGTLLLGTIFYSTSSSASCLTRISYAEARGESDSGILAVMQASLHHAKQSGKAICNLPARKLQIESPKDKIRFSKLESLARNPKTRDYSNGAVAWRSKGVRARGGKLVAVVGGHRFYKVKRLATG